MNNSSTRKSSIRALKLECELRERQFDTFAARGIVRGQFANGGWIYKGEALNFWKYGRHSESKPPLSNAANDIARCWAMVGVIKGDSVSTVRDKVISVRLLAEKIGDDAVAWASLSPQMLDRCVVDISKIYKATSAYHRASCLGVLVEYLNHVMHPYRGSHVGFLDHRIRWRLKLKNPIHSTLDRLAEEGKQHSAQHYKADLHVALGRARSTIRNNPELEPNPGFDLIRLEALAFPMAMGIRVGETCSLPADAYALEDRTGTPIVRVVTEKGQLPSARPVESIWAPLLSEAYDYLLNTCAPARARARQIEQRGFAFVVEELEQARKRKPLSSVDKLRLKLGGARKE
jgi:hypothetical protein